jgi:hypothetical protein
LKTDKELSKVFDIEVENEKVGVTTNLVIQDDVAKTSTEKVESDFDQTRKNLHLLLLQGEDALIGALEVAKSSEHPRAFEVVGNLIKQLADVNQQLMDLHKQKQNLEETKDGLSPKKSVTNNNAIFVGSTAELNKLINNMSKGE